MIKVKTLKNGLKFLKVPHQGTEAVAVLVMVKVGSRQEIAQNNGVSHFVEHLMFKGTKKRPNTQILSQELDKIGAEFNAFTSKDHTGYYIKAEAAKIDIALDVLSDILFNSVFDKQEIEKERGVITEEINMYEDTPMIYCGEMLEELLFGAKHPLGRLISGPKTVIKNISREEIINYKEKFYLPSNMIIAVAGKMDKNIEKKVQQYFFYKIQQKKVPVFIKFHDQQKKKRILIKFKETEQVHLALGVAGLSFFSKDLPAINLLSIILGGNMSSRLFINIRERMGLCYYIKAGHDMYEDTGIFSIQAGLDKNRVYEALAAILIELDKIVKNGVDKDELIKAQDYLAGKIALDLEESLAIGSWYAKEKMFLNDLKTPEQKLQEYKQVRTADILRVAKKIFKTDKLNLSIIGPYKNEKKFLNILKLYA
ncbi:MAG: pitrilysin family protein [Patescibacteria group bacterium]|jgi:predicted Zn-dependent peptidase